MSYAASGHLLNIVTDSGGRLVAEQAPQNMSFSYGVALLLLIAALVFLWFRQWVVAGILLLIMPVFIWIAMPGATRRITIDSNTGQIAWQAVKRDKEVESGEVALQDLASADLAFGAPGGRLVLLRKDGGVAYPLGSTPLSNEPAQFLIVNRIKALLGQPAQASPVTPQ